MCYQQSIQRLVYKAAFVFIKTNVAKQISVNRLRELSIGGVSSNARRRFRFIEEARVRPPESYMPPRIKVI